MYGATAFLPCVPVSVYTQLKSTQWVNPGFQKTTPDVISHCNGLRRYPQVSQDGLFIQAVDIAITVARLQPPALGTGPWALQRLSLRPPTCYPSPGATKHPTHHRQFVPRGIAILWESTFYTGNKWENDTIHEKCHGVAYFHWSLSHQNQEIPSTFSWFLYSSVEAASASLPMDAIQIKWLQKLVSSVIL